MHSPINQKMDKKNKSKIPNHKNQEREKLDLSVSHRGLDLFKSIEVIDMFQNIRGNNLEPYLANKSNQ